MNDTVPSQGCASACAPSTTPARRAAGRAAGPWQRGRRRPSLPDSASPSPSGPPAIPAWEAELRRLCQQGNKWDARIADLLTRAALDAAAADAGKPLTWAERGCILAGVRVSVPVACRLLGVRPWTRRAVRYWRERLGLPGQKDAAARRLSWQLKHTNNLGTLQDQRAEVHRQYQSINGWPEDLAIDSHAGRASGRVTRVYLGAINPRQTQLLCLLWEASATSERRSWTRAELAEALASKSGGPGRRRNAMTGAHDPLRHLLALGVVVRAGRRRGGRYYQTLYAIRPGLRPYTPETQRPRAMELAGWQGGAAPSAPASGDASDTEDSPGPAPRLRPSLDDDLVIRCYRMGK